jgi:carbamoyltransferase
MKFLGLRLCEHDSNITYSDGKRVKYYKSERDYQIKHHGFDDLTSWSKIIKRWNINPKEVDAIGIVLDCFRHPKIKTDESKLYETIDIDYFKLLGFDCPIFRIDHHYAHSLSSWTLGIDPTISFVFDGFGDDSICHSIFKNKKRILEHKIDQDYLSLGQILSIFGNEIGLSGHPIDHAGKVMALKGYGTNKKDINFKYDLSTLKFLWNIGKYNRNIFSEKQFKSICDHVNFCHNYTEKIYTKHFKKYSKKSDIISYTGGIAQNTIINSQIKKKRKNLYIPPHCNDEGLSLGIIEFLRIYFDQEKFDTTGYPYWQSDESPKNKPSLETIKKTAEFLSEGKIIGWYQGNGEVGPRALGNRSILMHPGIKNGKNILNEKVKHREFFRPFGASVLQEKTARYFDCDFESPHMLYVVDTLDADLFPSITHIDGTCRIQTVSSDLEIYYSLIYEFEKITGIPLILNTSLNDGGKPICGSIDCAINILTKTGLDVLVVGDEIFTK